MKQNYLKELTNRSLKLYKIKKKTMKKMFQKQKKLKQKNQKSQKTILEVQKTNEKVNIFKKYIAKFKIL